MCVLCVHFVVDSVCKPVHALVLSGCCVHCQQPVEILSGAPCFMSESYVNLVNVIVYLLCMY